MADVSSLNNEHLQLSPTLSEGHEGAATRRGLALEAAVSDSSRQAFPEGVSLLDRPAFRVTISADASRLARVSKDSDESSRRRELSEDDRREVEDLKKQDRRVRQHEQAHVAAGGRYVRGGAKYEYTTGPDGKRYATGGEVPVDLRGEKDPRATIQKMNTVRRAALAPADPSAADRAIAARASGKAAEARKEISEDQRQEPLEGSGEAGGVGPVENPFQATQPESSPNRTEQGTRSRDSSEEAVSSAPDPADNAVLRTGLLRVLSVVTAPAPQGPTTIDRYA